MPRDLFGDVTNPSVSIGNRKWYTVPVSLLSHSALLFGVVVIPLMATDVVPRPWQPIEDFVVIAPVKPPAPPPRPRDPEMRPPVNPDAAPTIAPDSIEPERPVPDASFQDGVPADTIFGDGKRFDSVIAPLPPPPQPDKPVRVGFSGVRAPMKVREVQPVYPRLAIEARVQGVVIIEATIGADGRITDARVLRSIPLLDQAAIEAVRQWEYTPTQLNGVPVPVIMTVTVTFTLSR